MDIDYKKVISFRRLKEVLNENRIKNYELANAVGCETTQISGIINGVAFPKTDLLAAICRALSVPASEICTFTGYDIKPYFKDMRVPYVPAKDAEGKVTYRPLRRFLEEYLREHEEKTADDLFDKIEPSRRRNGQFNRASIKKALEARGITEDYEVKRERARRDYTKGLPFLTRTKLRQDRPLNIRNIYDICRFLGCSIDFVMSYK